MLVVDSIYFAFSCLLLFFTYLEDEKKKKKMDDSCYM